MKKTLFILLPVVVIILGSIGAFEYFRPQLQKMAMSELERFSRENLPVIIRADDFRLQLISPAVQLFKIRITAKDPKELGFKEIEIDNVRANLDFLQALGGRIFLSSVVVNHPDITVDLDPLLQSKEPGAAPTLNLEPLFHLLQKLPLFRFAVVRTHLELTSQKLGLQLHFGDLDLIAFNQRDKLNIKLDVSDSNLDFKELRPVPFALRADVTLSPESLEVSQLHIGALHSELEAEGKLTELKNLTSPVGQFTVKGELTLARLRELFKMPLVPLFGNLQLSARFDFAKNHKYNAEYNLNGKAVKVDQFTIGDFEFKGDFKEKTLKFSDLILHHPSGDVKVSDFEAEIESFKQISLKAKVETEQIDLHELLATLGIGDIPLELFVKGHFDCGGPLLPKPEIICKGQTQGEQFEIRSGGDKVTNTIAAVEDFGAEGEVKISAEDISYKADLHIFQDKGQSDGVISYKNGFRINYSTPELHFKNIKNLANLKLEGVVKGQGQTSGDSHHGIFSLDLDGKDIFLQDFGLGDVKTNLRYEKGNMFFDRMNGAIGNTHYSAKVALDLQHARISAEGQAPALEISDVLKALSRKATLPIEITGFGSAFVKLNGPLQFNQLNYTLSAQAFRGHIAGESYDRMQADISATNGEVKADKVLLTKNKSIISVFGKGHPNGQIDLTVRGERFLLEESENISKLSSAISGVFNFQMGLTGHVLSPDLDFRGALANLTIEEQEFPGSTLNFTLNKQSLDGVASLLGARLKSEFTLPLADNLPFRFRAQAKDWNFATLFTLIGGASLLNDYQTTLTGSIDLNSEHGGFFKSTGRAQIDQFLLKRGSLSLSNKKPMELTMKNGVMSLSHFRLDGDQSFVEVKGTGFTRDNLALSLDSNANLRLFHIFVPFFEEFGGMAKISVAVSGALLKPQILGTANVENAFVKLKGFPHPFEKIESAIQFSASKILINHFTGNIAGGSFKGDGGISIEGPRDLPMNITAHVDSANLNVPDGVRTLGDADLSFSGNWFPFLLSGTYRVKNGVITKDFSEEAANGVLQQSSYLPKVILQSAFEPIVLDIQVQLDDGINIKNSLVEGVLNGQLQIKGPPTQPVLYGKIVTESHSKLFFRDKIFDVSSGNLIFRDPNEINPDLYLSAHTRVTDYDISLVVQGTAKAPQLRLTSIPPLSEPDIVSLLALGVLTAKSDNRLHSLQNSNDNQTSATAIGSAILSSTKQGRKLQDNLGVNVQLSSSYDDTKNVAVQKITLSKKIRDKVDLSASRIQGQQNSNEYKIRYNFNGHVSAVGTYEERQPSEDARAVSDSLKRSESILGVDLEYKKEFK